MHVRCRNGFCPLGVTVFTVYAIVSVTVNVRVPLKEGPGMLSMSERAIEDVQLTINCI